MFCALVFAVFAFGLVAFGVTPNNAPALGLGLVWVFSTRAYRYFNHSLRMNYEKNRWLMALLLGGFIGSLAQAQELEIRVELPNLMWRNITSLIWLCG